MLINNAPPVTAAVLAQFLKILKTAASIKAIQQQGMVQMSTHLSDF
jgi:hypothetical protein